MVNLFRVMRDQCAEIQRLVKLTPFERAEFDLAYEPTDKSVEKAPACWAEPLSAELVNHRAVHERPAFEITAVRPAPPRQPLTGPTTAPT